MKYWKDFDSTHCKNLFFRNHKGNRHYLVILECHKQMDIHGLEHQLHQGKLSFASEQRMEKYLGTVPGSVSLFGLINDPDHQVKLYLDKDLRRAERVTFHPNDNTASLEISRDDMYRFIQLWGGECASFSCGAASGRSCREVIALKSVIARDSVNGRGPLRSSGRDSAKRVLFRAMTSLQRYVRTRKHDQTVTQSI